MKKSKKYIAPGTDNSYGAYKYPTRKLAMSIAILTGNAFGGADNYIDEMYQRICEILLTKGPLSFNAIKFKVIDSDRSTNGRKPRKNDLSIEQLTSREYQDGDGDASMVDESLRSAGIENNSTTNMALDHIRSKLSGPEAEVFDQLKNPYNYYDSGKLNKSRVASSIGKSHVTVIQTLNRIARKASELGYSYGDFI